MSIPNILELVFAIIIASGLTSVIFVWCVKLIGGTIAKGLVEKFKSDLQRELESYKTKLKKSEFLFQKEFDAASDFIAMKRGLLPPYRFPHMDWGDALEEIAQDLGGIEKKLDEFVAKHGAILPAEVLDMLSSAQGLAAENKFQAGPEPHSETIEAARQLWEKLKEIEGKLRDIVHSQSST